MSYVQELHPITIVTTDELVTVKCTDPECDFAEEVHGHSGVFRGLARGAEHALCTGHEVVERTTHDQRVRISR